MAPMVAPQPFPWRPSIWCGVRISPGTRAQLRAWRAALSGRTGVRAIAAKRRSERSMVSRPGYRFTVATPAAFARAWLFNVQS